MTSYILFGLVFYIFYPTTAKSSSIFVVIGGTGELSSKSLWDVVFKRVYSENLTKNLQIYTSGRSDDAKGKVKLDKIVKKLHCTSEIDKNSCENNVNQFVSYLRYKKLENDVDYGRFCAEILTGKEKPENLTEILWYLATPPSYYPVILMSLYTHCRNSSAKMKIALEKPFWKDQEEYIALTRIISARFQPQELYFIDHFLAKDASKALAEFKQLNSAWFKLRRLEKLELTLLERESVGDGRLKFYDSYGVVRDVMMSHLNHLMLMLLSHNDENLFSTQWDEDDERDSLRDVLNRLRPFSRSDWILGQHQNFQNLTKYQSKTPTFASIRLKFDVAPDSGNTVEKEVLLLAGKYMDAKRSYARVVFKNEVSTPDDEVIFLFTAPLILINLNGKFSKIGIPEGWIKANESLCQKWISRLFTQTPCSKFVVLKSISSPDRNPHEIIMDEFLATARRAPIFTKLSILEESWKILWSHVLKDLAGTNPNLQLITYGNANEVLSLVFPNKMPKVEL